MKKVIVLLSTYNGALYLNQQLKSLTEQVGVEIEVLVRDDGSSDSTLEILRKWSTKMNLHWYTGENLGPAMSFMDLMRHAPDSEYYALCDQDDVWLKDKLHIAVEKMKQINFNGPVLYYGVPRIVDKELEYLKQSERAKEKMLTFSSAAINSNATGCTMVFNRDLLRHVISKEPSYIGMHDAWIHKVCVIFRGKLIFDDDVHILYRQHANNAIGISTKKITRIKNHIKSLKQKSCARSRIIESLYDCYKDAMRYEDAQICKCIIDYKTSIAKRLSLAFNYKIHTVYPDRNLLFRLAVLLGAF